MSVPIGQQLTELAACAPDRPLVTCAGATVTRAELESRANRLARAYAQLGVRRGSLVTVALPNGIEFFCCAFAVWKLGAIPQPVSNQLPHRERAAIVELADPDLVVGVDDASHPGRACVPPGFRPGSGLSAAPLSPPRVSPAWKAPTSGGSTGRPKVIISGQSSVIDPALGQRRYGMQPEGVQLVAGPLHHNGPFTHATLGLLLGNHIIVLPKFDPAAAFEAIEKYRVDWLSLVPTMMVRMQRVIASGGHCDLSSIERLWHMAAPCPAWVKDFWICTLGAEKVFELYGGTEGQFATTISGSEWLRRPGSVGKPIFGQVRVLDQDGRPCRPGEIGEVFGRPDEGAPPTYRYLGAQPRARDGWESLGDLGWLDEDGYLFLADRRTDLILSGGENVYPAEVEAALLEHPSVQSCVVVGLPDDDLGQRAHAVVQARPAVTAQELLGFVSERLVRHKVPRSVRFVDESLRDDAGKVRRAEWRDREAERLRATASNGWRARHGGQAPPDNEKGTSDA